MIAGKPTEVNLYDAPAGVTVSVAVYDPPSPTPVVSPVVSVEGPTGSYSATISVATPGQYLMRWVSGAEVLSDELLTVTAYGFTPPQEGVGLSPNWRPSLSDVGGLIRARTFTDDGNELGTFTDKTNPTGDVVEGLITDSVADCIGVFGWEVPDMPGDPDSVGYNPDALKISAARTCAKRAAAYVELTRFPEQVANGRSPYAQLIKEFESGLKSVGKMISDAGSSNEIGAIDDAPQAMSDGFLEALYESDEYDRYGWR